MDDRTAAIDSIRRRLLSRKAKFHKNPALLLDRLDYMTQLLEIRKTELIIGQEINRFVVAGFETIKDLSWHLRQLILQNPSEAEEVRLAQKLLLNQEQLLEIQDFRYVIAYEWVIYGFSQKSQLIEEHRGDLVLMDDRYNFVVIELKHIRSRDEYSPQGKSRTFYTCKQARKFAKFLRKRFPWATVNGFAVTNYAMYRPKPFEWVRSTKLLFADERELITSR